MSFSQMSERHSVLLVHAAPCDPGDGSRKTHSSPPSPAVHSMPAGHEPSTPTVQGREQYMKVSSSVAAMQRPPSSHSPLDVHASPMNLPSGQSQSRVGQSSSHSLPKL